MKGTGHLSLQFSVNLDFTRQVLKEKRNPEISTNLVEYKLLHLFPLFWTTAEPLLSFYRLLALSFAQFLGILHTCPNHPSIWKEFVYRPEGFPSLQVLPFQDLPPQFLVTPAVPNCIF